MGRRRKPGTEWLPERVYLGKAAYEFRPPSGGAIRLCDKGASQRAVLRAYDELMRQQEMRAGSVAQLIQDFLDSDKFNKLALSTRKKYATQAVLLTKVFGKMSAASVKPVHVRQYMDARGKTSEVQANREKAFLQRVYSWGYDRGKVTFNPCKGVSKFKETPRDRYITDAEYLAVYNHADPLVRAIMEISFCCAARIQDVRTLMVDQIRDEGLFIYQEKTGKKQIKRWTPRLRKAIEQARQCQTTRSMKRIVADESGQLLTHDAFDHRWRKARDAAKAAHPELQFDFTFHDVKAKSISDYEGDKQKFSGHKSPAMVATYDRKTEVVDTNE